MARLRCAVLACSPSGKPVATKDFDGTKVPVFGSVTEDLETTGGLDSSTAIRIGGDPVIGTTHVDAMRALEDDSDTEAIVMIGGIGAEVEERAVAYISNRDTKPVVGYIAGG